MEIISLYPSDPDMISEKNIEGAIPFSTFNSESRRLRRLKAIVAMANDRAIGRKGTLPWHLPEDLAHFKATTLGNPIVMGRKTWESLPRRPLPGRRNMVVSANSGYVAEGAEVFGSVEMAIAACPASETPIIIGGASIYKTALPYCTDVIVTQVDTTVPDADTFFPELSPEEWEISDCSEWMTSAKGLEYRFVSFSRK